MTPCQQDPVRRQGLGCHAGTTREQAASAQPPRRLRHCGASTEEGGLGVPPPYRPWTPTPGLQSQGGSPIWGAPRAKCLLPEHPDHTQGGCRGPVGEQRGPWAEGREADLTEIWRPGEGGLHAGGSV